MAEAASSFAPGVGNPLANPAFLANPYPLYAMLRATSPVLRPPIPGYEGPGVAVLTRYGDVEAVLRDPRFSVDRTRAHLFKAFSDRFPRQLLEGPDGFRTMLMMDPPDHTRIRHLVSRAFTPRRVEERLRPRIEALVDELLAPLRACAELELMRDFAEPLPAIVIAELLGVPARDHRQFKQWSSELVAGGPARAFEPGAQERTAALFGRLREYVRGIVAERRKAPGEDMISGLIDAQEEHDALSEGELISTSLLLLIAGHETTTNLIGNGLLALLRHPDQLERLRREPDLLENAIEELLRYDSPVQATVRIATEDVAIAGSVIPKDAIALALLGAANRDPAEFPEPDRLDLARENVRHLSFGLGTHFCLGAGLARLEARLAFRGLLALPGLRLATDTPEYRPNPFLRGLRTLPLRLG
jgi:pimeloyl-[acyl-carrier protein] synthase